jgi:hypothetical protein
VGGIDGHLDREAALGIQPKQRAREPVRRFANRTARGARRPGRGPGLREVVVHLGAHALDLLPQQRGELGVAGGHVALASWARTARGS